MKTLQLSDGHGILVHPGGRDVRVSVQELIDDYNGLRELLTRAEDVIKNLDKDFVRTELLNDIYHAL